MKNISLIAALLAVAAFSLTSCTQPPPARDHVAIVNGAPISVDEYARDASMAAERYPEIAADPDSDEAKNFVLDSMILKKLMIQEAAKRGLSEDKEFLDTIKMFWEQTLIKKLIDTRSAELSKNLAVTDEEAKAYYQRMRGRLTMLIAKAGSREDAEALFTRMKEGVRPEGAEMLGPIMIEDLKPTDPLSSVFDLPADTKTAVIEDTDEGGYLAVRILKRDEIETPPLEAISGEIKSALLERKKELAFNEWLEGVKKAASIKIDRGALERAVK